MDVLKDERFKHLAKDPRFRNVPKKTRKVRIDKRFQSMFTDDKFKLKYAVDQRGRPVRHTQVEDLKRYYDLSEDEEGGGSDEARDDEDDGDEVESGGGRAESEEDEAGIGGDRAESEEDQAGIGGDRAESKGDVEEVSGDRVESTSLSSKVVERLQDLEVDYARGEGLLHSESSSSDEPSSDEEAEVYHGWGEADLDAERTDEATDRLAVCHMDWDRIRAVDIMVLLHSFLPPTGFIHSVTIYPSEYGLSRMKEEELKGPSELTQSTDQQQKSGDELESDEEYNREKLREYQMKRLRYYYAVVKFDSVDSANRVYTECDGMEYESSATRLDLRFIPDDMDFPQECKERCASLPEGGKYRPRLFANTALQQEKVELTWDETDPYRLDLTRRLAQGHRVPDSDIKQYLATSSDEDSHLSEDDNEKGTKEEEGDKEREVEEGGAGRRKELSEVEKYRQLVSSLEREEMKRSRGRVHMEVSWDLALDKALLARSSSDNRTKGAGGNDSDNLVSEDEAPVEDDTDDKRSGKNKKKKKKKKRGKMKRDGEDSDSDDNADPEATTTKRELELLLAEDDTEESGRKHFNYKDIQDRESKERKRQRSSKAKSNSDNQDDFQVDTKDERFEALYTSHLFNIDPADPHYKRTRATEQIVSEKLKRRRLADRSSSATKPESGSEERRREEGGVELSPQVRRLVSSVKNKTKLSNRR